MTKLWLALLLLLPATATAKIYKCEASGKTTYQQTQCSDAGTEIKLPPDISKQQQVDALNKMNARLAEEARQLQLKKARIDKERMIRAAEDQANATDKNARANRLQAAQQARQARALERQNEIERRRLLRR